MKFLETKFIFKTTIKSVFGINELHLKFVNRLSNQDGLWLSQFKRRTEEARLAGTRVGHQ